MTEVLSLDVGLGLGQSAIANVGKSGTVLMTRSPVMQQDPQTVCGHSYYQPMLVYQILNGHLGFSGN